MAALSVQRVQLSADPDDWVWVRWYRPRPGARVMPFPTFGGFDLWQDYKEQPPVGPHVDMIGGDYRPEVTSPFPGLDFEGTQQQWQEGLPPGPRAAPDVGVQCGAEFWTVDLPVDVGVVPTEPEAATLVRGGGSGGGPVRSAIPSGSTVRGGGSGGGPIAMATPCLIYYGSCDHPDGGGAGGGPVSSAWAIYSAVEGGGAGGGPVASEAITPACDPSFVGGVVVPVAETDLITGAFPAGITDGDTVVIAYWHTNEVGVPPVGAQWTHLNGVDFDTPLRTLDVYYLVYDSVMGTDFSLATTTFVSSAACLVTFRCVGTPFFGEPNNGSIGTATALQVVVADTPSYVLGCFATTDEVSAFTTASGQTSFSGDPSPEPVFIYYDQIFAAGPSTNRMASQSGSGAWGALMVCLPPE